MSLALRRAHAHRPLARIGAPALGVALALLLTSSPADAQATDVEVPVLILDTGDLSSPAQDEALDLANIVVSAAKGVTTVQEAPAIVTVVTADEIRDRQFQPGTVA